MERSPRRQILLLAAILLGCAASPPWRLATSADGWQVDLGIAQVEVRLGREAAPVRNRTPLFDIGQVLAMLWGGR